MSETFNVGETALLIDHPLVNIDPKMQRYIGDTAIIEASMRFIDGYSQPHYIVRSMSDWSLFYAPACCLQKLPPSALPADLLDAMTPLKVTRWSESPWRPREVKA